jgi:hypothetical protein
VLIRPSFIAMPQTSKSGETDSTETADATDVLSLISLTNFKLLLRYVLLRLNKGLGRV